MAAPLARSPKQQRARVLRPGAPLLRSDHHQPLQRGEKGLIPDKAVLASLGCGNPTALIDLKPGEMVLDLGSGGGIDVLLSARRVAPPAKPTAST